MEKYGGQGSARQGIGRASGGEMVPTQTSLR